MTFIRSWIKDHPKTVAVGILAISIAYVLADKQNVDPWRAILFGVGSWGAIVLAFKEH